MSDFLSIEQNGRIVLHANGELGWYVSVLTPPIPQWVPYVAGGEMPTQLKSAKPSLVTPEFHLGSPER